MRLKHLALLACPVCRGSLRYLGDELAPNQSVESGTLQCSDCGQRYPIHAHIPRFVPNSNYADGFGLQWNAHVETQYDSYTGLPLSERRFFSETGWLRRLQGELILEAGCGSGRFTPHAASTGAVVLSFDYSNAVDANYAQNGHLENVCIVQADIFSIPCRPASFSRIYCFGVLQHTPDPRRAFFSLVAMAKAGGHLVVDVYKRNRVSKLVSFTPAPPTKYWVRPVTKRLPPRSLYALVKAYVLLMWPASRVIARLPRYGRNINWMLLIADHSNLGLSDEAQRKWAVLNTFDMLAPRFDIPQTIGEVRNWFQSDRFADIEVDFGFNGIVGKARIVHV